MTTVLVFLKIAGKTIAENWKAFVVAAILATCLWIFLDWRAQAEEIATLEQLLESQVQITETWRAATSHQSAKALEAAAKRDDFERRLAEALARPPVEVIKWKETEPTIHTVVVEAADCTEAVAGVGKLLRDQLRGDGS